MVAIESGLGRRIRTALRLATNGEWRKMFWFANVRLRKLDFEYASLEELGLSPERSVHHASSGGPDLEVVLKTLDIKPTDSVLDFGCGKGAALLTMAKFPYKSLAGVDISPEMVEIARENLSRMHVRNAEINCSDATAFVDLDRFTHVYFYNPFPWTVMRQVMRNIHASLERRPRNMTIIYKNPMCHEELAADPAFAKVREFDHSDTEFHIYAHKSD
jgi:SAM-dependent methyltransferase